MRRPPQEPAGWPAHQARRCRPAHQRSRLTVQAFSSSANSGNWSMKSSRMVAEAVACGQLVI